MRLQTVSEQKAWRQCPRYHHNRYGLGYRAIIDAGPLHFGRLVHLALAAWWAASGDRLAAALAAFADAEADPVDRVRVEELLCGYDARWSDQPLETLAVEAEFRAPLVNPLSGRDSRTFELGGAIDAIARDAQGRVWIVEHKTSAENIAPGSEYWQRLRLDAQVSTYLVGARALGHEPVGCLYDIAGKPRIRPALATPMESRKYKKDGTLYANQRAEDEGLDEFRLRLREEIVSQPDRYYQRGEVLRSEDDERDAAADAWATARAIREAEVYGRFPRNPDGCVKWGRRCEFFDVCTRAASLDDPQMFRRAEKQHEELQEVA